MNLAFQNLEVPEKKTVSAIFSKGKDKKWKVYNHISKYIFPQLKYFLGAPILRILKMKLEDQ